IFAKFLNRPARSHSRARRADGKAHRSTRLASIVARDESAPVRTNNGEEWEIACAQLCGLGHYRMRGMLVVDTHAELQKWLSEQPTGASGQ
ncbi:MAG: hypothetical protein ACXW3E_07325, partial [Thermoanaerobaculia bacterium]